MQMRPSYKTLNPNQMTIYDKLMSVLPPESPKPSDRRDPFYYWVNTVIRGYAGTGKSYLTGILINDILKRGYRIFVVSPNHEATAVISEAFKSTVTFGSKPAFVGTIHSALGLKIKKSYGETTLEQTGIVKTRSQGGNSLCDIMVVDECSQLDNEIYDMLVQDAKEVGYHILRIGDPKQLKSIKDGDDAECKALIEDNNKFELTEITRQAAGSPIIKLSEFCRDNIDYEEGRIATRPVGSIMDFVDNVNIFAMSTDDIVSKYISLLERDPNKCVDNKTLSFTNNMVNHYNNTIRSSILGANAPDYVTNEIILMKEACGKLAKKQKVVVRSIKPVTITLKAPVEYTSHVVSKTVDRSFDGFELEVQPLGIDAGVGQTISVYAKHEVKRAESFFQGMMVRFRQLSSVDRRDAGSSWKWYYAMMEEIASVDSIFSGTIYSSQGASIQNVIVDMNDAAMMLRTGKRAQFYRNMYVAVSRSKDKLFIAHKTKS